MADAQDPRTLLLDFHFRSSSGSLGGLTYRCQGRSFARLPLIPYYFFRTSKFLLFLIAWFSRVSALPPFDRLTADLFTTKWSYWATDLNSGSCQRIPKNSLKVLQEIAAPSKLSSDNEVGNLERTLSRLQSSNKGHWSRIGGIGLLVSKLTTQTEVSCKLGSWHIALPASAQLGSLRSLGYRLTR